MTSALPTLDNPLIMRDLMDNGGYTMKDLSAIQTMVKKFRGEPLLEKTFLIPLERCFYELQSIEIGFVENTGHQRIRDLRRAKKRDIDDLYKRIKDLLMRVQTANKAYRFF